MNRLCVTMTGTAAVVVLLLAIPPSASSEDGFNICEGVDVVVHTSYKEGEHRCCKTIRCGPGTEAVICDVGNPYSTSCRPCPDDTFQQFYTNSVDMEACNSKQHCREGMKVEYDLSAVYDRRCICDVEQGLCNQSRNRSNFCQFRSCPVGKELSPDCSCSDCVFGSYKDTNDSMRCQLWRNCEDEGREMLTEGSTETDRICGQTVTGFRKFETTSHQPDSSGYTANHNTAENEESKSTAASPSDDRIWIIILVTSIAVTMAGVAALGIFLRRKRKCLFKALKNPPTICKPKHLSRSQSPDDVEEVTTPTEDELRVKNPRPEQLNLQMINEMERDPLLPRGSPTANDCTDIKQPTKPEVPEPLQQTQLPVEETVPLMDVQNADHHSEDVTSTNIINQTPQKAACCASHPFYAASDWTQRLQRCGPSLVRKLYVGPEFLSILFTNDAITKEMKEEINVQDTRQMKVDVLLDNLPKRPAYAFPTLIFALVDTQQSHLAKKLSPELTAEFESYLQRPDANPETKPLSFRDLCFSKHCSDRELHVKT